MNEHLIKKLISTVKCNVCRKPYEIKNIAIIGHENDTWYLNVFCKNCARESFVAAIIKREKAQEPVTDLTEEEFIASAQVDLINSNDLLDIHNFLKNFDGNFMELFKQR
jgi:hypothetical protein